MLFDPSAYNFHSWSQSNHLIYFCIIRSIHRLFSHFIGCCCDSGEDCCDCGEISVVARFCWLGRSPVVGFFTFLGCITLIILVCLAVVISFLTSIFSILYDCPLSHEASSYQPSASYFFPSPPSTITLLSPTSSYPNNYFFPNFAYFNNFS